MSANLRFMNACFTLNLPEDDEEMEDFRPPVFDEEVMNYLCYQEEVGASGNYHLQGYVEFTHRLRLNAAKAALGSTTVHLEPRRGTQAQAIAYCRKVDETTLPDTFVEFGELKKQGQRVDLVAFKDAVSGGARLRDLVEDHIGIVARYPKLYNTLTMLTRPKRTADEELVVTLLIGATRKGKSRYVYDKYGDSDDFYGAPISNGTMWFDGYDRQSVVLLDDFAGAANHVALNCLLQLLDRYPVLVPYKGGFCWWMPTQVFITTNIYPKDWYKWENRGEQYKALAARFHTVLYYPVSLPGANHPYLQQERRWWEENAPAEAVYINGE